MNKILSLIGLATAFLLFSCGGSVMEGGGDLLGAGQREGWVQTLPFGMVYCMPGTFHMGQADEDVAASQINFNKQVTIGGFYMDETEITNSEYKEFVFWNDQIGDEGKTMMREAWKNAGKNSGLHF